MNTKYTLITGAGSGIGKALAEECAFRKMNLLLVALPNEGLGELSMFISKKYGVTCQSLCVDLSTEEGCCTVFEWVRQNNFEINCLINNVGVGSKGTFDTTCVHFNRKQIVLNAASMCTLTNLLLPVLRRNKPANILNLGSLGGFFFMPGKVVYSATKAFVYSFSRSLRLELHSEDIKVSVLCPGGTDSNANTIAINKELQGLAKWSILTPEDVAKEAIPKMLKGEKVIIPGKLNKCYYLLNKIIPDSLVELIVGRTMDRIKKHEY